MAKTPVIEVLFPEFGNLAGDNGNAEYLERCLPAARFIRTPSQDEPAFAKEDVDLIVMSNMTETQQERALERLRPHAQRLAELADAGVPMLFTGAAAEVMGESFQTIDGRELAGLGLFAFAHEQNMPKRYLSAFAGSFEPKAGAAAIPIVGFHAQFTQLAGDNSGCYFAKGERGWGINEGTQLDGFVRGGAIWLRDAAGEREVLPLADIRLPGWHNVENYMAALLAVDGLVCDETVRRVAREFAGVEHRIEFVRELHGVRYYNDSIATSPTRTIAGLRAFPHKVVLIAGGYDKHIPFAPLAPEVVEHVKTLILCGATADAIERAVVESEAYETAAERPRILRCKDLREAVDAAYFCAESGDVVTLSPACAAFDCYANFMERGRAYKEMVKKLGE